MENSIIDYIFYADSDLHDRVMQDAEYKKASEEGLKAYKKFEATLTDEQKTDFIKFLNIYSEEKCICNDKYFKLGVKVGLRLAAECVVL